MNYLIDRQQRFEKGVTTLLGSVIQALPPKSRELLSKSLADFITAHEQQSAQDPAFRHSQNVSEGWALRREQTKLYLFDYEGEEPKRVSYEEAAQLWNYTPNSVKVRISSSHSKSIAVYKNGRIQVLAKTPEGLQPALDAKYLVTQNPEHRLFLSPRPTDFRVAAAKASDTKRKPTPKTF